MNWGGISNDTLIGLVGVPGAVKIILRLNVTSWKMVFSIRLNSQLFPKKSTSVSSLCALFKVPFIWRKRNGIWGIEPATWARNLVDLK